MLPLLEKDRRTEEPLRHLFVAQQCGGSDAFSGVSANPIIGRAVENIVAVGGSGCIAESDELVGAERHMLARIRSKEVGESFLSILDNYRLWLECHGQSASMNPSGGNTIRGLYNITLKSIGAGMKKSPQVRLDFTTKYGQRLRKDERGYIFMDSPGMTWRAPAGVAVGANLITFTTGNGAITNHPLVPTFKVLSTSERFRLVGDDMDFNAGRLLEESGEPQALSALVMRSLQTRGNREWRTHRWGARWSLHAADVENMGIRSSLARSCGTEPRRLLTARSSWN